MHTGPNIERDGLVFGYDTHDNSRFYKGPSTTNHLIKLNTSFSNTIRTNGKAVAGEEEVNIPTIGIRKVKYVEYFNNYNNGNDLGCCPNLFNYHGGTTVPLVGNQSYTYSIVYKHTGGYTHPNFMYRYRYKADNTYIGEGGLHSTARRTHLGDGWYHAWGSWTTNSDANYGRFYSFLYNYGTTVQRFYVAAISLVKNNSGSEHLIIPPNLLLEPNTSVGPTDSITDLKKELEIDVSNMSFDSTGQPTFDGTDDDIDLGSDITFKTSGGWSVVSVAKFNSVAGSYNNVTSPANFIGADSISYSSWYWSVLSGKLALWNISPGTWRYGSTTLQQDTWYHVTLVSSDDGTKYQMYLNGVAEGGDHTTYNFNPSYSGLKIRYIGRGNTGNRRLVNGNIPITKVYDRALTPEEVKQNYNSHKNRFDI